MPKILPGKFLSGPATNMTNLEVIICFIIFYKIATVYSILPFEDREDEIPLEVFIQSRLRVF